MSDALPPPGWYADGHGGVRWWDGTRWTEHRAVAAAPSMATPPLPDTRRRVIAYLIDWSLSVPGMVIYLWAFFDVFLEVVRTPAGEEVATPDFGWILFGWSLAMLATVVNRGIVQGLTGRSLGKRIMHLRLVRLDDGGVAGLWWGLLRVVLETLVGIIDVVLAFVTDRRQRTGDMAAKTVVMNDEDYAAWFR
jgi:uncharacterized RDD family membrane protein YckC